MSAPDAGQRADYGTIVVVGGGCYGSYYVRQLGRAMRAGALRWARLLVVDRDAECRVARAIAGGDPWSGDAGGPPRTTNRPAAADEHHPSPAPEIVLAPWSDFFDGYLGRSADAPAAAALDAVVPSPLMPHLMYEWLLARARRRWPNRSVGTRPLQDAPPVPWQRAAPGGTHFVSFAEWTCPVNCIEPARCPVTRGQRDWSLPPTVRAFADAERARGRPVLGPAIFHCTHRAYGVGMIDIADVLDADRLVARAGTTGPATVLVGTMSHCHGALDLLELGA